MNTAAREMKAGIWLIVVGVVAASLGAPMTVGAAPPSNPPLNVDVAEWSAGVVPVNIHEMPQVSAEVTITNEPTVHAAQSGPWGVSVDNQPTVHAAQSGDWSVDIASMPNVHAVQWGTWGVEVTNEPGVQASQSGEWSVDVDSLPPVAIDESSNGVTVSNSVENPVPVTISQGAPEPVSVHRTFSLWDDDSSYYYSSEDATIEFDVYQVPDDKWLVITSVEAKLRSPIVGTGEFQSMDIVAYGSGLNYARFGWPDGTGQGASIDVDCEFRYTYLSPGSTVLYNIFRGTRDCNVLLAPGTSISFSMEMHGNNASNDGGTSLGTCNLLGILVDQP